MLPMARVAFPTAVRVPLRSVYTPQQALLTLRDDEHPFALIGHWAGGGAIVGSQPVEVAPPDADPFELLDRLPPAVGGAPGAVGGGWFGWLGYGLGARVERLPPRPPRPVELPDAHLAYYDHVLPLDPEGKWWFEALSKEGLDRLDRVRELLREAPEPR